MASNDTVQARVTPELKANAEAVFAAIGLKTSDAIRLFLQQAVNTGGLPFQPKAIIPNAETIAAIEEAKNRNTLQPYASFRELRDDVGV